MADSPPDPITPSIRTTDGEDAELLERLRHDDRDALAALYDKYGRLAYGLAYRTVGETREAEDVVQEAFLTLWRQAARLDRARGSLRPLLLTIVRRRAIDVLRRRPTRSAQLVESIEPLAASASDPIEFASQAEERERVRQALAELPDDQRQAIELTYFDGLTVAEMAARERIPLGTAKSRLRLALDRMRKRLTAPDVP